MLCYILFIKVRRGEKCLFLMLEDTFLCEHIPKPRANSPCSEKSVSNYPMSKTSPLLLPSILIAFSIPNPQFRDKTTAWVRHHESPSHPQRGKSPGGKFVVSRGDSFLSWTVSLKIYTVSVPPAGRAGERTATASLSRTHRSLHLARRKGHLSSGAPHSRPAPGFCSPPRRSGSFDGIPSQKSSQ